MKFECTSASNRNKSLLIEGPDHDHEFEVTISTAYEDTKSGFRRRTSTRCVNRHSKKGTAVSEFLDEILEWYNKYATDMRKLLATVGVAAVLAAGSVALAGPASAAPCSTVVVWGNGGSTCESDFRSDGSFTRCDTVYVLGIGGTNCYRVYP